MADEGLIDGKKTAFHRMGGVPKVTVLRVVDVDEGEAIAIPDSLASRRRRAAAAAAAGREQAAARRSSSATGCWRGPRRPAAAGPRTR